MFSIVYDEKVKTKDLDIGFIPHPSNIFNSDNISECLCFNDKYEPPQTYNVRSHQNNTLYIQIDI